MACCSASPWCDDGGSAEAEDCALLAQRSLEQTLANLGERLGSEMAGWRWDQLHSAVFPHQPLDNIGPLQPFFSRSIPNGGDDNTINLGTFSFDQPGQQQVGPGYRQVIDLSALDASRFIQSTGQSGHFLSSHYADYLEDWQAVRYRPMRFSRAAVEAGRASTLLLQ